MDEKITVEGLRKVYGKKVAIHQAIYDLVENSSCE